MRNVHKGTSCPCWDHSPEKYHTECLHPSTVIWNKKIPRFSDEEQDHTLIPHCPCMEYRGPSAYPMGSMTRKEYDDHLAHWTKCLHHKEYEWKKDP
jgi:hypothetical protein